MLLLPLYNLRSEGCNAGQATRGWIPLSLVMVAGHLELPFALLLCPWLTVYQPLGLDCCLCPSSLPSGAWTLILHCAGVQWDYGEWWTASVAPVFVCPTSCYLCSLWYAHLQISQSADVSDMFVYCAGNSLFNYTCPTYNFKRRDFSCLNTADVTFAHLLWLTPLFSCLGHKWKLKRH